MSQENVEVVRKPLRVRERSSRTLDERLALRFPRLFAAYFRRILKLPSGSRLRQAALWRAARLATEAFNRRDLDVVLVGLAPDWESTRRVSWWRQTLPGRAIAVGWASASGCRLEPTSGVLICALSRWNSSTWGTGWCCSRTCLCAVRAAVSRSRRSWRLSSR
jgi:hypothetical protein